VTDPQTDRTIGRYTILGKLGAGGMAEVFLARSKGAGGIDKTLVIKKIHPVLARNERFIDMFMEEARVAMRLNHSNIVQVYAFEHIEDDYILAMEHVDGSDLLDIQTLAYQEGQRIPFGLCAFIAAEIAKGLDYAHSRRDDQGVPLDVVHRDVSPQNVLISRDGGVKVTDFGIVKARSVHEEIGEVKGKLGYMSPQQAKGLPVDRRADIFSLGVVLHEMLVGASGQRPKVGEAVELDPPVHIDPEVPGLLSAITMRALAPDPDDRYQTARDMVIDLNNYLRTEEVIYDATALGDWIAATIPQEKMVKVKPADGALETGDTTATEDQTRNLRGFGEFEQQAVVMVSVSLQVEESRMGIYLRKELNRLAEEIAYKSGGIFRIYHGVSRLFLGLPTSSFEDSMAGIRVAKDLMDVVETLGADHKTDISAKISVNRGHVKVARNDPDRPLSFEPENDIMELASLLLGACAPRSILSGQAVFDIARTDYHFDTPLPIEAEIPGRPGAIVHVFGHPVIRAKSRQERSASAESEDELFTGREKELQKMQEAFQRAVAGRACLLKLTGELGLGKSSLIRRFCKQAEASGAAVATGECLFAERDTPLAGAAAAIRALLRIEETFTEQMLYDALESLLGEAPQYLERQCAFLGELVASPESVWERHRSAQRELIRRTAFGMGTLCSRLAAAGPLVLVVDNAQWLDGPSVDVLAELAQNLLPIPVLTVLAGQPGTLSDRRIENLESIELSELGDSAMRRLIARRIGTGKDVEEISRQILERSHGNPFFANEIMESLISRGILEQVEEAPDGAPVFVQKRPGVIHLPTTVKGIAESRINTLTISQRTVLRTAAVIGAGITLPVLEWLIGADAKADLDVLMEKGFLVPSSHGEEKGEKQTPYHFKRAIEREAAYEGLSRGDRRQLHQKLARRLMKQVDSGRPVPPVRIAWHLDRSGQSELAAEYYLKAGDAAMSVYSSRRALRLFDRALSILPLGAKQRFDVLLRKDRVIRDIGMHDIQQDTIKEMEELGERFNDNSMRATAAYRYARYQYNEGNFREAAAHLDDALRLSDRAGDRTIQVESLRALGYLAIEEGDLDRAMDCADLALGLIPEPSESPYLKARILGLKGLVFMETGHLAEAAYPLAYAVIAFRRLSDRRNESVQLANLGLLAQARGNLIESLGFFEHALAIDREIRDVSERGRKLVGYADIRVELGQFETGESLLNDALRICRENYEPMGELEAELGMADLLLQRGRPAEARDVLVAFLDRPFLKTSSISRARHLRLLTEAFIGSGDPVAAVTSARDAIAVAERSQMKAEVAHGASLYALALAHARQVEKACDEVHRVEEVIGELGRVRHGERIWWRCARTLHLADNREGRDRALEKARNEVERKLSYIENPKHRGLFLNHPLIVSIMLGNI